MILTEKNITSILLNILSHGELLVMMVGEINCCNMLFIKLTRNMICLRKVVINIMKRSGIK